jgi:2,5-diketo-D-gluconate reductase B
VALLKRAVEEIGAPIAVNQFEYHVLIDQAKLVKYARSKGVVVTAYCPLAQGRLADHPSLAEIAKKHGVSAAQVALKWLLDQDGVAAIPKAGRAESQQANLDAQNLVLDDADRAAIAALPKNERFVNPGFAPSWDVAA